ncbi:uncharacterized protein I303_100923 [Kwoniella dejecticola CBS 10117]|uniref:Uncharacterized protein n=1 Tax=Kwoniella dejecticola CBS 10117 TaxID=1296121 RepID=A0A1A6AG96_9TREE|nr:uncharacterized protein I303_00927 [Kwoniella dejecticola CBS 10117]OBR89105.1 hypothetical protein I303_00927 [Kwoniella dejecticola CBS 10117]
MADKFSNAASSTPGTERASAVTASESVGPTQVSDIERNIAQTTVTADNEGPQPAVKHQNDEPGLHPFQGRHHPDEAFFSPAFGRPGSFTSRTFGPEPSTFYGYGSRVPFRPRVSAVPPPCPSFGGSFTTFGSSPAADRRFTETSFLPRSRAQIFLGFEIPGSENDASARPAGPPQMALLPISGGEMDSALNDLNDPLHPCVCEDPVGCGTRRAYSQMTGRGW